MKKKFLTYLSLGLLLSIVGLQSFLIYQIYQREKRSLQENLDLLIENAHKKDVDLRIIPNDSSKTKSIKYKVMPPGFVPSDSITYSYNVDSLGIRDQNDYISLLSMAITEYANERRPFNIQGFATVVEEMLKEKNIHSEFAVRLFKEDGEVLESFGSEINASSPLLIASKLLPVNLTQEKNIQILLLNPHRVIFRNIFGVIFTCFLFSLFCIFCIWQLQCLISKQRKITDTKNEFFSHVSHELRRPLSQIHMAVVSLKKTEIIQNETRREKYLGIIKEANNTASRNMDMMLTLSKEEEHLFQLTYSEFDLLDVIESLLSTLKATTEKELEVEINNLLSDLVIKADKKQISQCLMNLFENAVKYSHDSVKIAISLSEVKRYTVITVKDNGIGISQKDLPAVFDKYNRAEANKTKSDGFGIGLHYVKTIVEKHSGKVEVESVLGKGSEFFVYLPKK